MRNRFIRNEEAFIPVKVPLSEPILKKTLHIFKGFDFIY